MVYESTSLLTFMLLGASLAALIAFVYPYLVYPRLLAFFPHKPIQRGPIDKLDGSGVALLFCAYNEEASLGEKLDNLAQLKRCLPQLRIAVYSDASDDGTDQLLAERGTLLEVIRGQTRVGKITGMRRLVETIDEPIIVLSDANTIVVPDTFAYLIAYLDDPDVGAVSGKLDYVNSSVEDGATAAVGGAYWRLEEKLKSLESLSGSMCAADGAMLAMRRDSYPQIDLDLSDDMAASLAVMFDGLRCVSAPEVQAFERGVVDSAEEWRRKRRISCGSYTTHRRLKSKIQQLGSLDRFKWFSHRVMRWWGGVMLLVSFVFSWAAALSIGFGTLHIGTSVAATTILILLGRKGVPPFAAVYEILRAITATTLGMGESIRGKRYVTWQPASSR